MLSETGHLAATIAAPGDIGRKANPSRSWREGSLVHGTRRANGFANSDNIGPRSRAMVQYLGSYVAPHEGREFWLLKVQNAGVNFSSFGQVIGKSGWEI